jgi:molybdenum cofactor cytidylyltransferase
MRLIDALQASDKSQIAFVGAGGKSTSMFHLARQLSERLPGSVFVTASTHLAVDQASNVDRHRILSWDQEIDPLLVEASHSSGVTLFTGPVEGTRTTGLENGQLDRLSQFARDHQIPVLIEADGSKRLPLKAPAKHEPAIPAWVTDVVVVAGLSGLGKPLDSDHVHRPELFSELSGIQLGNDVSIEGLEKVLVHPEGGLKNIPANARRYLELNQADSPALLGAARKIAQDVNGYFSSILIAHLADYDNEVIENHEPIAAVILAAGSATRYGEPKVLLDYHGRPFIRQIAETALQAGLDVVVVAPNAIYEKIDNCLQDLPVRIVLNPNSTQGKSTSIVTGVQALYTHIGAALFFLGDMPQIGANIIQAILSEYRKTRAAIITPVYAGQRANPVLFSRVTFSDLLALRGEEGGKKLYSQYPPIDIQWDDDRILLDVDTPDDYRVLIERTTERN